MKKVCDFLIYTFFFISLLTFLSWVGLRGVYWYKISELPESKLPNYTEITDDLITVKWANMQADEIPQVEPLLPELVFYKFIQQKPYIDESNLVNQAVKLIKKRYPEREFSSIDDMVLSIWISQNWNARDVLSTMLAEGDYGDCCKDIHHASNYYFDKPVYKLDLYESILLVAILDVENSNPLSNKQKITERMNFLIKRLKEQDDKRFKGLKPVGFEV